MNFFNLATFDPSFPDIAKAIRKFCNILSDEEECKKTFLKDHSDLSADEVTKISKKLLAPSRINDISQQAKATRVQKEGRCIKCGKCCSNPRGRKRDINLNSCSVLKEGTHFRSKI